MADAEKAIAVESEASDVSSANNMVKKKDRKRKKKRSSESEDSDINNLLKLVQELRVENIKLKEEMSNLKQRLELHVHSDMNVSESEVMIDDFPALITSNAANATVQKAVYNSSNGTAAIVTEPPKNSAKSEVNPVNPATGTMRKSAVRTTATAAMGANRNASKRTAERRTESSKRRMPPALIVYNLNQKEASTQICKLLSHKNFVFNILNKNVTKITLCTMADYIITKEWLKNVNAKYYTFTPSELKPYSIILNKLPHMYDEEDVKQYFIDLDLDIVVIKCTKWGSSKWLIQLGRETDMKAFLNIKYVLNCKISFSKFQSKGPVQCKNCQRFNHVASNCHMPYRCVKCGESHGPQNCSIPPKELNNHEVVISSPSSGEIIKRIGIPVKCVNCGIEGHTANARICPKRQEIVQKSRSRRDILPMKMVSQDQTFASLLRVPPTNTSIAPNNSSRTNSQNAPSSPHIDFEGIDNECKRLLGKNFAESLKKIGEFSANYNRLTADSDKSNALFGLLISLRLDA